MVWRQMKRALLSVLARRAVGVGGRGERLESDIVDACDAYAVHRARLQGVSRGRWVVEKSERE